MTIVREWVDCLIFDCKFVIPSKYNEYELVEKNEQLQDIDYMIGHIMLNVIKIHESFCKFYF